MLQKHGVANNFSSLCFYFLQINTVELMDHMIVPFFIFWETSILFSIVTTPIYIPFNKAWGFLFTFSQIIVISNLFDNSHSNRCEVISHSRLIFISLMINGVKYLFMYLLAICMSSLEKISIQIFYPFFFWFILVFYLFMAVLGLRFCARAFSSCGKWGPLFIAVRGAFTITASLIAEPRLQMCRLSNCGSRAQLLRSMWDLPRPGLEPMCPALAGRFSTTAPPGKPFYPVFNQIFF